LDKTNYITPEGFAALRAEYEQLFGVERPRIVEVVSWAAGNGDRSENGDYLYGRKRMREIDSQLRRLSRKMKDAKIIDPALQPDKNRIFFGATVTIADEEDKERTLTIIGNDETDTDKGRIGWDAPLSRALRGASVGDVRRVRLPSGEKEYEVIAISYPETTQ
jgi:transcription elongation factor GreB